MSTESGIPDFRSSQGLWTKIDPMQVARPETIEENYKLFHEFYKMRVETLNTKNPHDGHRIIADWEKRGLVKTLITQNVDGFHQLAGSQKILPLHGTIREFRCHHCQKKATESDFIHKKPCQYCGGPLRPNVVLFGESLPMSLLEQAMVEIHKSTLVIVIGTSLRVYPVSQLPEMTKGKKVFINRESVATTLFDLVIQGNAQEVLMALETRL